MAGAVEGVESVGGLAVEQWGLITTAQARAEGMSTQQLARLTAAGALERLRHGVYRVAGAPVGPQEDLRAAWLAFAPAKTVRQRLADPGVEVVSYRSAASLHQLGDLDAEYLEFTTSTRKQTRDPQVRIHRRQLQRGDWTLVEGLPVTTVLATISDLAGARVDGGHLAGVVRDAVTTHHLGVADVAAVLSPHARHYGAPLGQGAVLLQRLLEQAGVPESTHAVGQIVDWRDPSEQARQVLESVAAMSKLPALAAFPTLPVMPAIPMPVMPVMPSIPMPVMPSPLMPVIENETLAAIHALQINPTITGALLGLDTGTLESIRQALNANAAANTAAISGVLRGLDTGAIGALLRADARTARNHRSGAANR